jgi:hypothetical protein
MKRALVFSLVVLFGVGIAAFGQLTGSWETSIGIDPGAFFTSLDSTLTVDYALSDWTFGAVAGFDIDGFASQKFSVGGALGAFTLASTMSFDPMAVTLTTYADVEYDDIICPPATVATTWLPKFLKWDVTGSVSIAGVTFSAYVLQNYGYYTSATIGQLWLVDGDSFVQTNAAVLSIPTKKNGMGWRLKVAGSFGAVNVTSYTYFGMTESAAKTTYGLSIAKGGVFTLYDDCELNFKEEYVLIEGFTFGCVSLDMALEINCLGFVDAAFLVKDIAIGGFATFDFQITFTTTTKTVATDIQIVTPMFDCIVLEVGFGSGSVGYLNKGNVIDNITIHGFKLVQTFGGLTFTSATELDSASKLISTSAVYNDAVFLGMLPFVDALDTEVGDYYEIWCGSTEKYAVWEMFSIDVDADACCGGLFDLTITTLFGDHYDLVWAGYVKYEVATAYELFDPADVYGATEIAAIADVVTALTDADEDALIIPVELWVEGGQTTLFNWAKTSVDLGVGIGANIALTFGFDISAFGWESLDVSFKWSF